MVKIEALDTEWAEIGWRRFNLPCCTDYPPRRYRKGLDLLIQKETDYLCSHRLQTILIFDIKAIMHNKSLRGYKIEEVENWMELHRISIEAVYKRQKTSNL